MDSLSEINKLLQEIDLIDRISDDEWKANLNDRKRKELEFHDRDRDSTFITKALESTDTYERFYGNKKYYSATKRSNSYVQNWIARESKGKIFLDYACGNGANALHAAACGAELSLGFDISGISVKNAKNLAIERGLESKTRFFQADAESTKLPDSSIDTIICSGMLHHLDLSFALPELRRILKPGGKMLAVEALDYNPIIKLYRHMTPAMRTDWERAHILDLSDVAFASRFLEVTRIRYWHIFGYIAGKISSLYPVLDSLDILLEKVPYIQRLAWIFTIEFTKNKTV